jgi:hypothetical protein
MAKSNRKTIRIALPEKVMVPIQPKWLLSDLGAGEPASARAQRDTNVNVLLKLYRIPPDSPDKLMRLLASIVPGLQIAAPARRGPYKWTRIEQEKLVQEVNRTADFLEKSGERRVSLKRVICHLVRKGGPYEGEKSTSLKTRLYEALDRLNS